MMLVLLLFSLFLHRLLGFDFVLLLLQFLLLIPLSLLLLPLQPLSLRSLLILHLLLSLLLLLHLVLLDYMLFVVLPLALSLDTGLPHHVLRLLLVDLPLQVEGVILRRLVPFDRSFIDDHLLWDLLGRIVRISMRLLRVPMHVPFGTYNLFSLLHPRAVGVEQLLHHLGRRILRPFLRHLNNNLAFTQG